MVLFVSDNKVFPELGLYDDRDDGVVVVGRPMQGSWSGPWNDGSVFHSTAYGDDAADTRHPFKRQDVVVVHLLLTEFTDIKLLWNGEDSDPLSPVNHPK